MEGYTSSEATLVKVASKNDNRQYLSVVLQNGFLKLIVSLDSYNTERVSAIITISLLSRLMLLSLD